MGSQRQPIRASMGGRNVTITGNSRGPAAALARYMANGKPKTQAQINARASQLYGRNFR